MISVRDGHRDYSHRVPKNVVAPRYRMVVNEPLGFSESWMHGSQSVPKLGHSSWYNVGVEVEHCMRKQRVPCRCKTRKRERTGRKNRCLP